MNSPKVTIACVSNLFVRQMCFENVGDKEESHNHKHDHLTLLTSGKLKVIIGDNATEFIAPHMIFIKANVFHELIALEPNTLAHCIHALRDLNGDIFDPNMYPKGTNLHPLADSLLTKGS